MLPCYVLQFLEDIPYIYVVYIICISLYMYMYIYIYTLAGCLRIREFRSLLAIYISALE